MKTYTMNKKKNSKAVFADETFIPPKIHREVKMLKQLKKEKHGTTKVSAVLSTSSIEFDLNSPQCCYSF